MTPIVREMIKIASIANIDPIQMMWFDVTATVKDYLGAKQEIYLLHPAPYPNMMLCGRTSSGDFMLSVIADTTATIVSGWMMNSSGYKTLGSFLFAEHEGQVKVGPVGAPIDAKDQSIMGHIVAMFYASLDQPVEAHVPTPHKANVSRAKHGLKPLYDWHTIVIEPPKKQADSQGGTHASPRRHQARGHWRNYKSGKRGWVKDCWRGDAAKGTVFKDYQIKEQIK